MRRGRCMVCCAHPPETVDRKAPAMDRSHHRRRPARLAAALLALLMLLAGCGGAAPPPVATIAAAPLPADWQPVELPEVAFALPPEWSVTSADDLDFGPAATAMAGQNPQLQAL